MGVFLNYEVLYPDLLFDIVNFFSETVNKNGQTAFKDVMSFCNYYHKLNPDKEFIQPSIISTICDILCENRQLSSMQRSGFDNVQGTYYCILSQDVKEKPKLRHTLNKQLSYLVYGFKYIYEDYKQCVLPVEYTDNNGDKSLGTCFLYDGGIATAKHCIEGAKAIAIQGIPKEILKEAKFEIHQNLRMDLLFIRTKEDISNSLLFNEDAEILDEVMTMGYPIISGFHNFLTAENATVAARFTASTGQIVSNAEDIFIQEKLFLITAKIKGGNSGGPVIKKNGYIVGISSRLEKGEGNYDDLGYGTVIPISFLNELRFSKDKHYLNVSEIEFKDFK